jgi:hypothetical protein
MKLSQVLGALSVVCMSSASAFAACGSGDTAIGIVRATKEMKAEMNLLKIQPEQQKLILAHAEISDATLAEVERLSGSEVIEQAIVDCSRYQVSYYSDYVKTRNKIGQMLVNGGIKE